MKIKFNNVNTFIVGFIIAFVVINLVIGLILILNINKKIADAEEATRPAQISLTIIKDNSCADCFDVNLALDVLKANNVEITDEKTLDYKEPDAQKLINDLNIDKVPTFIAEGELDKDAKITQFMNNFGQIIDNKFIFRQVLPIYTETASGEKRGDLKIVHLIDDSCTECYDVAMHNQALNQIGVSWSSQESYLTSSAEGQALLNKYNIKLLPTIILQGDLDVYLNLVKIWPQVGEIADDGSYIFTKVELMGTYKNLATGTIIEKQTVANTPAQNNSSATQNEVQELVVVAKEFEFIPGTLDITKGEKVKLTFINNGDVSHDFAIDELGVKTNILSAGETETIEFIADQAGQFEFYCTVPGHKQSGMVGKINVK